MAYLFGKKWTQKQLLARIGDPSQLATLRPHELTDGKAKGLRAVRFATGSGFGFTVTPDRALDVTEADHCGRSLCWRSPTGDVSPYFYQPEGLEWLYGFAGGLLCTCGLTYYGAPCEDEGVPLGLHGRVSSIPAQEVNVHSGWVEDEYVIGVRGKVVESSVFGPNVVLSRSIFAFMGQDRLFIHDEVTNQGHEPAPHMMLYHVNFGFPVVDGGARVVAPSLTVTPRDAHSAKGKENYASLVAPVAGTAEKVYYHDLADDDGMTMAGIVNPSIGFGAYVRFHKKQLPHLIQWKMLAKGQYVVGLEPGTNKVEGRAKERAEGRLRMLKPGETAEYNLELGALTDKAECADFEKAVKRALGRRRTRVQSLEGK